MSSLTPQELKDLTGYKMASKQVAWVRDQLGINAPVGADGRPRLTWEVVNAATLGRHASAATVTSAGVSPNWSR